MSPDLINVNDGLPRLAIPWTDWESYEAFLESFSTSDFLKIVREAVQRPVQQYPRYSKYERRWARLLDKTRKLILAGERSAARVLRLCDVHGENRFEHQFFGHVTKSVLHGAVIEQPYILTQTYRDALCTALLSQAVRPHTRALLDIGAGSGRQLLDLWHNGAPRHLEMVAMEITVAGRLCGEVVAELDPTLEWRSAYFDFNEPDFGALGDRWDSVLAYTRSSIEQIERIEEAFFEALLDVAAQVRCVHFEPIGWQASTHRSPFRERFRGYAEAKGHNVDLWPVLQRLERRGWIEIMRVDWDVAGRSTDKDAVSYVEWEKR